MTDDEAERRRYALLQAAAIYIAQRGTIHESSTDDRCGPDRLIREEIKSAVSVANALLREIERRGKAERER